MFFILFQLLQLVAHVVYEQRHLQLQDNFENATDFVECWSYDKIKKNFVYIVNVLEHALFGPDPGTRIKNNFVRKFLLGKKVRDILLPFTL